MLGEPAPPNGQIRSYGRWTMDLSGASLGQWVIYLRSSSGSKSILLTRLVGQGRVRDMSGPGRVAGLPKRALTSLAEVGQLSTAGSHRGISAKVAFQ